MKLCVLALLVFSSFAMGIVDRAEAIDRWVTVGSAGTVDEEDLDQVDLNGAAASVKVLSGSARIRYNVLDPPVLNVNVPGQGLELTAIYVDNGPAARVIARLVGVKTLTGVETTLVELDTNSQQPTFTPKRLTGNSCAVHVFNFEAVYIDVVLRKISPSANAKILALRVGEIGCPLPPP